jgi:two-component system sensor histidine kinase MprB
VIRRFLNQAADAARAILARSLRNRLILLTTLAVGLGAVLSSVAVYQVARNSLYEQLDNELLQIATAQAKIAASQITSSSGFASTGGFEAENAVVLILRANRANWLIWGDQRLAIDSEEVALARIGAGTRRRNGLREDGVVCRIVAVPFQAESSKEHYALVLGRDLTPTNRTLQTLQLMQWIAGLIGIAIGGFAGLVLSRASLQSIRHLNAGVAEITATDHLRPVTVEGNDEVAQLGRSFNTLVDSLATSRERQRRLIADASHELRTPLTSLRTNVELLIADENTGMLPPGARSDILRDVAEQLGEFTALIGDLVALSREEEAHIHREPVEFREVVTRALTRAQRRGPGLEFDVDLAPLLVAGEASTLERAVTNLLDNAVKFSPPGGRITVRLEGNELRIRDQGPGIADEDLPHIFERFYRSDRSRNTPGTGLGLSIVDHTVTAHGGTIAVIRPADGGAEFVVRLPVASDADEEPPIGEEPI